MICLEKVSKFILEDVSLHIPQGAMVGIIGASGAGKTTLLKLICGLLQPEAGQVFTLGRNPLDNRKTIGEAMGSFFPKHSPLQREESVEENLRGLKAIYRISDELFIREYEELSERLGFAGFTGQRLGSLSLGRRRVELGAVLLHRPKLLLLDEPTTGLDQNGKEALYQLLKERSQEGATIVITSHDMAEVSLLCERIVLLEKGKLYYYGDCDVLLKRYAPMDRMELTITGALPDMEDLPLEKYVFNRNRLTITYNSNHITAAEILRFLLSQTAIREVNIRKPGLADIILQLSHDTYMQKKERKENESFY